MTKTKTSKILKFLMLAFIVAFAGAVGGIAFKSFFDALDPKIVPTGMSGLSMLIAVWLKPLGINLSISIIYLFLNVIIFAFAFKFFGWKFMLLSAIGLGAYVLGMQYGYIPAVIESVNGEPLVLCLVGSIITGMATGIAIRFGGSTGGSDVFGKLLNRIFPRIKTGYCILIFNAFVLILSIITFGLSTGLYALINSILSSIATDMVLDNSKKIVAYFIICDKAEEVSKGIMSHYGQGVTKFEATGMFTGNQKQVLLCLVPYDQSYKMKDYVANIDPGAFIFSTTVTETIGEGNFLKQRMQEIATSFSATNKVDEKENTQQILEISKSQKKSLTTKSFKTKTKSK